MSLKVDLRTPTVRIDQEEPKKKAPAGSLDNEIEQRVNAAKLFLKTGVNLSADKLKEPLKKKIDTCFDEKSKDAPDSYKVISSAGLDCAVEASKTSAHWSIDQSSPKVADICKKTTQSVVNRVEKSTSGIRDRVSNLFGW